MRARELQCLRRMRAREVGEAQQAAKQAERDREAASRASQHARASCTSLETEVQRLSAALQNAQQGQRYSVSAMLLSADPIMQKMSTLCTISGVQRYSQACLLQ